MERKKEMRRLIHYSSFTKTGCFSFFCISHLQAFRFEIHNPSSRFTGGEYLSILLTLVLVNCPLLTAKLFDRNRSTALILFESLFPPDDDVLSELRSEGVKRRPAAAAAAPKVASGPATTEGRGYDRRTNEVEGSSKQRSFRCCGTEVTGKAAVPQSSFAARHSFVQLGGGVHFFFLVWLQ